MRDGSYDRLSIFGAAQARSVDVWSLSSYVEHMAASHVACFILLRDHGVQYGHWHGPWGMVAWSRALRCNMPICTNGVCVRMSLFAFDTVGHIGAYFRVYFRGVFHAWENE